jgi:hypothetical protein
MWRSVTTCRPATRCQAGPSHGTVHQRAAAFGTALAITTGSVDSRAATDNDQIAAPHAGRHDGRQPDLHAARRSVGPGRRGG